MTPAAVIVDADAIAGDDDRAAVRDDTDCSTVVDDAGCGGPTERARE
jgi:hypothetical protein